jgi:hypothetical protein
MGSLQVGEFNIILMGVLTGLQKSNFLYGKYLYLGNTIALYAIAC